MANKIEHFSVEDDRNNRRNQQRYSVDSTDGLREKIKEQLRRHRYLQVLFFFIILSIDSVDLIADWLFYTDLSLAQQGLVYGIPDQSAVKALLFFSIVGSITFVFETVNLGKELFTEYPWFNTDMISAITMWIEDIPQIAINVYISLCREDPISVFQLTKAAVVILGIVVRIIISSVRYCSHASLVELKQRDAESRRHVAYRAFMMLGLIINMAGAVAIFVFTQTSRDLSGKVIFEVPETIFEDRFHDDRYFSNVSVYFHHPTFDYADSNLSDTSTNWMRIMAINSIRNLPEKEIMFNYQFEDSNLDLKMLLWENDGGTKWVAQECYSLVKSTKRMTPVSPCDSSFISGTSIIFQFSFTPPEKIFRKLVFGDIAFNVVMNQTGSCEPISESNITDVIVNHFSVPVAVHYFRTTVGEANHVINEGGTARFYDNERDLIEIRKVWETGWMNCETKGSLAPHPDPQIKPPCDTI